MPTAEYISYRCQNKMKILGFLDKKAGKSTKVTKIENSVLFADSLKWSRCFQTVC